MPISFREFGQFQLQRIEEINNFQLSTENNVIEQTKKIIAVSLSFLFNSLYKKELNNSNNSNRSK